MKRAIHMLERLFLLRRIGVLVIGQANFADADAYEWGSLATRVQTMGLLSNISEVD